jgi:maleate isomerase
MYGWRGIVGLIMPPDTSVGVDEFHQIIPEGVAVNETMLPLEDPGDRSEQERIDYMISQLEVAVKTLDNCGVDVIGQFGAPFLFTKDAEFERNLRTSLLKVSKTPIVFMAPATVGALKSLGAKTVNVVTYYSENFNLMYKKYLEERGLTVKRMRGLPETASVKPPSSKYADISEGRIFRFSKSLHLEAEDADALLISGGGFRTLNIIEPLEEDLGVPVVSSNVALFWNLLKALRIGKRITDYGKLLSNLTNSNTQF